MTTDKQTNKQNAQLSAEKQEKELKTIDDVKDYIEQSGSTFDPDIVLKNATKDLGNCKKGQILNPKSDLFKAFTLFEFDKGFFLAQAVPEKYISFSIDFCRNLQKEYQCETPSEKATAELVALNFVRTIEIQSRINSLLSLGHTTDNLVKHFAILSKELDRANRHYLTSLQVLKSIKQPALEINIKSKTAIVGQNQIVQSNNK